MIEALKHGDAAFVTLTYKYLCYEGLDENSGSVSRDRVQKFLKRFRKQLPYRVRMFGVGEYGTRTQRPHYHIIIYGHPTCIYGRSRYSDKTKNCCSSCDVIRDAWGLGNIYVGDVTKDSIQYVAGYVTKKMTRKVTSFQRDYLGDREPEFPIYPNKPGLGALAVEDLVEVLTTEEGAESLIREGDIPSALKHGGRSWPLGRYLRAKIREAYGFVPRRTKATSTNTTCTPDGWYEEASAEVLAMLEKHKFNHQKIVEEKMQKLLNFESSSKIFNKRGQF